MAGPPQQERAAATRKALVESAAKMFLENGFSATTLQQISTHAGTTKGALYFHFTSKEQLAGEILSQARTSLCDTAHHHPQTGIQSLIDYSHHLARHLRTHTVTRAAIRLSEELHTSPQTRDLRLRWAHEIHHRLTHPHTHRQLARTTTTSDAANLITAATIGYATLSIRDPAWLTPHTLTAFWRLALTTLVPPEHLTRYTPAGTDPSPPP